MVDISDSDLEFLKRLKDAVKESDFEFLHVKLDEVHLGNREYRDELILTFMRKGSRDYDEKNK